MNKERVYSPYYILFIKKSLSCVINVLKEFCVVFIIFVMYDATNNIITNNPPIRRITSALLCPLLSIFLNMGSIVQNCVSYINYIVFCF